MTKIRLDFGAEQMRVSSRLSGQPFGLSQGQVLPSACCCLRGRLRQRRRLLESAASGKNCLSACRTSRLLLWACLLIAQQLIIIPQIIESSEDANLRLANKQRAQHAQPNAIPKPTTTTTTTTTTTNTTTTTTKSATMSANCHRLTEALPGGRALQHARVSLRLRRRPLAERELNSELAQDSDRLQELGTGELDDDESAPQRHQAAPAVAAQAPEATLEQRQRISSSLAKKKLLLKSEPSMLNSAVINGKVSLACDISPASADDSVALVLWYKDDSLAPIYTVDARKANSLERAKTSLDEAYANRANFNMRAKPAQLTLEPVRANDEGDYRCRVDFKRGRTVNTIISLRVVQLPDDLRIVAPHKPHAPLTGLIGPFDEDSELTLLCLATGGKPRPHISWRRDFNVIDETYQHINKEGTSNELKIPALSKNHLLSIFTCQASNNNLTSPMQSSITLDLNLKPQEVSLKPLAGEPLVVGQTVTFECLTHGSRPQATIHWLFQGARHDPPMNVEQQQTSSRLTLTLQRSFNQAALTCVAENPRIARASALRQSIKLDVFYPPQLSIKLEPPLGEHLANRESNQEAELQATSSAALVDSKQQQQQQQLQEGNDIYLTCHLDANPRPTKPLVWRFNGRPIQHGASNNMVLMNNQSLVLRKVSRQQSGAYSCQASNAHGSNSSRPLEVVIRHAPVCATDDILVFEATLGQTVTIDCQIKANPSNSVHYSWFFAQNERNISHWLKRDAGLDEQLDESSSRLKFKIRDEGSSFGLIKCKAKNEIGLQQRACLFQLAQARAPSLRHSCSLANVSASSLQVACSPNEHLKTEEFELVHRQHKEPGQTTQTTNAPPSLSDWLEAMRQPQITGDFGPAPATPNKQTGQQPQLRLVFPPNWLLAELYKVQPQQSQASNNNNNNNELVAYVVIGSSQQLANIKTIVEENGLFSSNPRTVYYVRQQLNNSTPDKPTLPAFGSQAPLNFQPTVAPPLIEDPAIKLADGFTFAVPNLEPETRYKMLIYGQNVANKTRDWLVVGGETSKETLGPHQRGAQFRAATDSLGAPQTLSNANQLLEADESRGANNFEAAANSGATSANSSFQLQQQKSLVMRSDTDQQQQQQQQHQQQQQQLEQTTDFVSGPIGRLLGASSGPSGQSVFADKMHQLYLYRDYAITYARKKPMFAIPMVLACTCLILVVVVRLSGYLARAVRRSGRRGAGSGGEGYGSEPNEGSKSSASLSSSSSPQANGAPPGESKSKESAAGNRKTHLGEKRANGGLASGAQLQHFQLTSSPDDDSCSLSAQSNNPEGATIYAIETDQCGNATVLDHELASMLYQSACAAQAGHHQHQLLSTRSGSIQEPLYHLDTRAGRSTPLVLQPARTATSGHALLQQHQVGSVDRRRQSSSYLDKHQPLLISAADLSQLAQERAIYFTAEPQHASLAAVEQSCYADETAIHSHQLQSYSSATSTAQCSSSSEHQQRVRHQRVAFDLSNHQQRDASDKLAANSYQLYPIHVSPALEVEAGRQVGERSVIVSGAEQVVSMLSGNHQRREPCGSLKGSDSGASSSGATAPDSGHESTPTGDMNSFAGVGLLGPSSGFRQQLRKENGSRVPLADYCANQNSSSLETCNGSTQLGHVGLSNEPLGGASNIVLMELSQGSQESAGMLLQSQTSDSCARDGEPLELLRHLHNNHQMATSFTNGAPHSPASQAAAKTQGDALLALLHRKPLSPLSDANSPASQSNWL